MDDGVDSDTGFGAVVDSAADGDIALCPEGQPGGPSYIRDGEALVVLGDSGDGRGSDRGQKRPRLDRDRRGGGGHRVLRLLLPPPDCGHHGRHARGKRSALRERGSADVSMGGVSAMTRLWLIRHGEAAWTGVGCRTLRERPKRKWREWRNSSRLNRSARSIPVRCRERSRVRGLWLAGYLLK